MRVEWKHIVDGCGWLRSGHEQARAGISRRRGCWSQDFRELACYERARVGVGIVCRTAFAELCSAVYSIHHTKQETVVCVCMFEFS